MPYNAERLAFTWEMRIRGEVRYQQGLVADLNPVQTLSPEALKERRKEEHKKWEMFCLEPVHYFCPHLECALVRNAKLANARYGKSMGR